MFNQDYKEFIELLNDNQVKYLVVGGYAVSYHGHPRFTKDLDLWVDCSPENAGNLVSVFKQFGMESLGLAIDDFLLPDQVIQVGYPPNRIDVITSVSGLVFAECYPKREQAEVDNVVVNFIDLENLKKNKRSSGRLQDLADLEQLT